MTQKELIQSILNIPAENQTVEFKCLKGQKVVGKTVETIVAMDDRGNPCQNPVRSQNCQKFVTRP
jgi:hypothetical protein